MSIALGGIGKKRPRRRGDDYNGAQPNIEQSAFLADSDRDPSVPLTPSAKTTALKDIVLRFQEEVPHDKIIIYTQWVAMAVIIGRVLEDEKINFVYFVGELGDKQRDKSLEAFKKIRQVKVMV